MAFFVFQNATTWGFGGGYRYCGPNFFAGEFNYIYDGNPENLPKGINAIDEACKCHDLEYYAAERADGTQETLLKLIADLKMIADVNNILQEINKSMAQGDFTRAGEAAAAAAVLADFVVKLGYDVVSVALDGILDGAKAILDTAIETGKEIWDWFKSLFPDQNIDPNDKEVLDKIAAEYEELLKNLPKDGDGIGNGIIDNGSELFGNHTALQIWKQGSQWLNITVPLRELPKRQKQF